MNRPFDFNVLDALDARFAVGPDARAQTPATIVVPLTWPNLKNAEYEVIKRFCRAAEGIGARVIVTDNDGYPVWASDGAPVDTSRPLGRGDADFMISLHFESPRLIDLPSYYAVWQPVSFYFDFGYAGSIDKLLTHTDMLSCDADQSDAHVNTLLAAARRLPDAPFPLMFHSPPKPYFAPSLSDKARLFYIGINWERLGQSRKGRHHELLRLLDEANLIDIYGPRVFLGAKPWEGYATYRGELPFDGASVVRALHGSGICLALSSGPHQKSGVMSNRLFEGLAAGAVIIANPHPLIDRYFAGVVYQVDDTGSDEEIFFQIEGIVAEIRADPEAANARARAGQALLERLFSLERCLSSLIATHPERLAARRARQEAQGKVAVVLPLPDMSTTAAGDVIAALMAQEGVEIDLILVCDPAFAEGPGRRLIAEAQTRLNQVILVTTVFGKDWPGATTGAALAAALPLIDADAFALVRPGESFFHDHFATLLRRLKDAPEARAAGSGLLDETCEGSGRHRLVRRRVVNLMLPTNARDVLDTDANHEPGRFLFLTRLAHEIQTEVLPLLDGAEVTHLLLGALKAAPMQATSQATCIRSLPEIEATGRSTTGSGQQRQFLLDTLRFDPEHAALAQRLTPDQAVDKATGDTDATLYWPRLFLDVPMDIRIGAPGVAMLDQGFSSPEMTAVWVDGLSGTLHFRLADLSDDPGAELDFVCMLGGRPAEVGGRLQHITVSVNGYPLGYFEVGLVPKPLTMRLPARIARDGGFRIRITADHAEPVLDASGTVTDPRHLGVYLTSLAVNRVKPVHLPFLTPFTDCDMGSGGAGRALVTEGGLPEGDIIWLATCPALLEFRVPVGDTPMSLELGIVPVTAAAPGPPIELLAEINDSTGQRFEMAATPKVYSVMIAPDEVGPNGICRLRLTPDRAVLAAGNPRMLSFGVRSIRLEVLQPLAPGLRVATRANGSGERYLGPGFSKPESNFTWVDGRHAELVAQLDGPIPEDGLALALDLGGRPHRDSNLRRCDIGVNGIHLDSIAIGSDPITLHKPLPAAALKGARSQIRITLNLEDLPDTITDADTGRVLDARRLGVYLTGFALLPAGKAKTKTAVSRGWGRFR